MTSYFFSVANGALWSAIRLAWIYSLCICSKPLLYTKSFIISVNCQWSSWSTYSGCTKSCGGGTQFTTRIKTIPESDGGTCSGEKAYSRNCNMQNCPGKFIKVEYIDCCAKFATGSYFIIKSAFIFNFLTRLGYKHYD